MGDEIGRLLHTLVDSIQKQAKTAYKLALSIVFVKQSKVTNVFYKVESYKLEGTMEEVAQYLGEDLDLMRAAKDATIAHGEKLEEIRLFARNAGIHKIGIAHCAALAREAAIVAERLGDEFETFAVGCKVSKLPLASILNDDSQGLACNPIGQVQELEHWGSEFNIVVGLCLGHDMLFYKYSKVPTTTLIVKDRAHKHNPMASLQPKEKTEEA